MQFVELLKSAFLGVVEGITEWLPISSTGHMILVDEFLKMDVSAEFMKMFLVVIQLGAILAVVFLYFWKLFPFERRGEKLAVKRETLSLWGKILVASIPAGVIGLIFDDFIDEVLSTPYVVAVTLIVYGVLFIWVENRNRKRRPLVTELSALNYRTALLIGVFQMLALIPGTSRSGATIVGALLIGVSRTAAAEFTFFLAIPAMFGASAVRMLKFGFDYTPAEVAILLVGCIVAFVVSVLAIKFLMGYIKKHDFKVFGWYRIVLGLVVLGYFGVKALVG